MILVTGGTGLVGSHLLYHLAIKNDTIRAIYRTKNTLKKVKKVFSFYTDDDSLFEKITWIKADITDLPSLEPVFKNITQVYHCAAFISFKMKDYRQMRKINIHGTAIIVNLCIAANIDKLCFVSSIAAVGGTLDGSKITEEAELNKEKDNSGYAITKFGAEMEVWRASQEGIDVIIVNPGVILGSGFWNSGSGKLFKQIYDGFKFYTLGVTGFVGVKDVVNTMILLMNSTVKNERFIVVSENKSFKELFFLMADAFAIKRPSVLIKPWQTSLLCRVSSVVSFFTRKEPWLNKYVSKSAHSVSRYSSEKLLKTINFSFQPINDVIANTCKDYINF